MQHKHPPTRCDPTLIFGKGPVQKYSKPVKVAEQDIRKSVAWYEKNWVEISEALPLTIEGTTYTPKWQKVFDYQTLPQWREGRLKGKAVAYVYLALKRVFRGLQARASPRGVSKKVDVVLEKNDG